MRFYELIDKNPNLLANIVSDNDVVLLTEILTGKISDKSSLEDKLNHKHIYERIEYELSLGGKPHFNGPKEPIIIQSWNAIDEEYYRKNKQNKKLLSEYYKRIDEVINQGISPQQEIGIDINDWQYELNYQKLDITKKYQDLYKNWGLNGFYKIFIYHCAKLYIELSRENYTFDENDGKPVSLGGGVYMGTS